jgi:hypothetical protein
MNISRWFAVAALIALPALPASAQQMKTVDGLVINFGLMSAEKAVHAEGHRDAHPEKFPSGSQHILVTLADEKTSRRIGNAQVEVEVIDPKGKASKKPLLHTSAAGMPDYSELFVFGWSGTYQVRVNVMQGNGAKPVKTSFTVHHVL